MTKNELIASMMEATGLPKAVVEKVLEVILDKIIETLARGEEVRIAGLGTFKVARRAARTARHPMTGEPLQIAARQIPVFKPAKRLKGTISVMQVVEEMASRALVSKTGLEPILNIDEAGEEDAEMAMAPPPDDDLTFSEIHSSESFVPAQPPEPVAGEAMVPVYYATNRKATGSADPNEFYEADRNEQLNYGRLWVSIPESHKIGEMERPTIWRLWRESPASHIVLREVNELEESIFFRSLSEDVAQLDKKIAFVFIHGFNVTFADASHRAAQMAYDLFLVGQERHEVLLSAVPIMFSWPSEGKVISYTHDATNAEVSAGFFKSFLKDVTQRSGAESLIVIAHSMGNRVLTMALKEIGLAMQDNEGPLVKEIILAAPDIDKDIFKQAAGAVMRTCGHATLYASNRDIALKASIAVNGFPRAGDASDGVVIIGGMDSIDASVVGEDLLAHSYYGEANVLSDMHSIITRGDPPNKRFGMFAVGAPPDRFWRIRARA